MSGRALINGLLIVAPFWVGIAVLLLRWWS